MLDQEQIDARTAGLVPQAAEMVVNEQKCSTSLIQRRLAIGYNLAARVVERLEAAGVVSSANNVGQREVIVDVVPDGIGESERPAAMSSTSTPMKETDADKAVRETAYRVAADELRAFVERFERLQAEINEQKEGQKEVMAEAKARGYDVKCIRKVIALRKRDKDDIAEEEAVLELYREALGV